jgi:type IX secretion system PorP/SprF family membrane protein
MNKTVLIILTILGMLSIRVKAQQIPMYSQYMFNPYIINPAYAGVKDYYEAIANYRYQWVGITDAPRTYILSVNGPHKTKNIGLGGAIYADVVGPTSKTAAYASGAYHLRLANSKLSVGLSLGIMQFRVDGQKIFLIDEGDMVLQDAVMTAVLPDFSLGAYWYTDKAYLGLSIPQFMNSKISFIEIETKTISSLSQHFMLNAGYKFEVKSDWMIEPSILAKYIAPVNVQLDAGIKAVYRDYIWGGLSWRSKDAFSILIGYKTDNDKVYFGYSYDITTSNLKRYSSGTHEIMVAAKFNNWKSRIKSLEKKPDKLDN